ncbi:MAG: hypothetical protein VXY06_01545 [Bacteroidota bacterium]|nr:hypothetical protein [Bacteroidota bacterium]MEE3037759.1 hypothetical protein [Bacteroidota bacterium]
MITEKLVLRGVVLGFLLPILAFVVYANISMDGDLLALFIQLKTLEVHTHVMSLCALVNLIPFFVFVRTKRDRPAQGVLMSTILIALFILINKFLF